MDLVEAEASKALKKAQRCKHKKIVKIIYAGFPMKYCDDCHTIFGYWTFVLVWLDKLGILPFNGVFMAYDGAYLPAVWYWITH